MKRTIGRVAAAALVGTAMTLAGSRHVLAQDSRGQQSGSSSSRSLDKVTDAGGLSTGLTLGVYSLAAPGVSVSGADITGIFRTKFGEGGGGMASWGITSELGVYASFDLAEQATLHSQPHGTFGLSHLEIGGRANIPIGSAQTLPYATASIGRRALSARVTDEDTGETGEFTLSGNVFVLGAGVQHFMSAHLALDAGVEFATGKFNHRKDDAHDYDLTMDTSNSLRLRLGVNWHP